MKLDELYISMASLGDEVRAKIHAMIASPDTQIDQHVKWLADWYNARDAAVNAPDGSADESCQMEVAQELSVFLATTPATSRAGLVAQIEWFSEDLGVYVLGNASPAHDSIFDTLYRNTLNITT
jgi:hypothetical protein